MATSGGLWGWHGPGPGNGGIPWRRSWRDDLETMTSIRPLAAQEGRTRNPRHGGQGRSNVTRVPRVLLWCPVVLLLLSCLSAHADACANVTCPTGCQCADAQTASGAAGCTVNCSSVAASNIKTLLSSIKPPDAVTALILHNCSISTVPDNAFTSFTSLGTVDLSYNSIQTLGSNVFHTLTNLEVLRLPGNKLTTLPAKIFAGRRNLTELQLSSNSISNLDANLFSDLESLEALYLDDNAFTHLPLDLFKEKLQMAKVDLSGNPWHCDCVLGSMVGWARAQQVAGHLLRPNSTTCATPTGVKDKEWTDSSLQLTQLICDLSALSSCYHDTGPVSKPVVLQVSVPDAVNTDISCNRACAQRGRSMGVFHQGVLCLCGVLGPPPATCCKPNKADCLPGAFPVAMGLLLGAVSPVSALSNMEVSLQGAVTNFSTVWGFGDGSDPVRCNSMPSTPVSHHYLLPGEYNVTLHGAGMSLQWPAQVVDPVGSVRLVAPPYSDAHKDLDIRLVVGRGTNIITRWSRVDAANKRIFGKQCPHNWHQHRIHKCVRAMTTSDVINTTVAEEKCSEENGHLLTFSNYNEMKALSSLLSKDLVGGVVLLVGAERTDNVTYRWTHTNMTAYFNTSVVTSPTDGLCVGLSATGLRGLNCTNIRAFVCKKGQVFCEHGGEEWDTHSCLVRMGEEAPLSQSEAQTACQAIRGHLTVIDTKDKEDFLHKQVLNNYSPQNVWLGLSDRHTPGLFLWPGSFSLGAFAPWMDASPMTSSSSKNMCVSMATSAAATTWSSVGCDRKMAFVCEYPTGDRIAQVQTTVSGSANFTVSARRVTTINASSTEQVTGTSNLTLIPGHWFQHAGGVQSWRFVAQNLPNSTLTKFRLQVHRPVCERLHFLVPPGCSDLPCPFATCSASQVNCSSIPSKCSTGSQFCPLLGHCIENLSPCTCAALEGASSTGCGNDQSTSQTPLTSPPLSVNSFRFSGIAPRYTLVAETLVRLQPNANGMYNVDARDIQVEPNDIIGVQFTSGDDSMLCDSVTTDMDSAAQAQSILNVVLAKDSVMTNFNISGGIWRDSMVCNLQAIATISSSVSPPANLRKGSVHSAGLYTYRASLYGPSSDEAHVYEVNVTMQDSVKGLTMANPEPKYPRRTAAAYKLAVVKAESRVDLLWYISLGTDPAANCSIPGASLTFSSACPLVLSHISQCSKKNYQFLTHSMATAKAGNVTTVTVNVWNMVSSAALTIDILAQEIITGLAISKLSNPIEIVSTSKSVSFVASVQKGTDVHYEWSFGDGKRTRGTQLSVSHAYTIAGIYTIDLTASNELSSDTTKAKLKLFKKANVRNLRVVAPSNVDAKKEFTINLSMELDQGSSITIYIYFGENDQSGNNIETFIDKPEFQANGGSVSYTKEHQYTNGDIYNITVLVIDNLSWDYNRKNVLSLIGKHYVKSVTHGTQSWTVLTGLMLTSTPRCHAVNEQVTFKVTFPVGFTKSTFNLTWGFGDKSATTHSFEEDTAKHTYSIPGTYDVTLSIQNSKNKSMASYKKCIQKPISAVSLSSKGCPYPIALSKGKKVTCRFDVKAQGSHFQYTWAYNSQTSNLAPGVFSIIYREAGTYTVKLNISNDISYKMAESNVTVVEVIQDLTITHSGVVSGSYNYFKPDVQYDLEPHLYAGSDIQWQWKIDGKSHSTQKKTSVTWSSAKSYSVFVTATNPVGHLSQTITAVVEEPVYLTSVTTFTDGKVGEKMTLEAMASGTTVSYYWTVCVDNAACHVEGRARTLITTPSTPGMYNYTVCAENHVSDVCNSSRTQVWGKMKGVSIIHPVSIVNNWAKLGKNLTFIAEVSSGIATGYKWVLTTNGQANLKKGNDQSFTVIVYDESSCLLTLTVTNPMETVNQMYTFNVEEAVVGLEIHAKLGDRAYTGETLNFSATYTKGSYPTYKWTITKPGETKSGSVLSIIDDMFYTFNSPGNYTLVLNVNNHVTDIIKQLPIYIKDINPEHKIVVEYDSQPWVHQNILIECHVDAGSGITAAITGYTWSVYDSYPVKKSHGVKMNHTFTKLGTYIIEVRLTVQKQPEPVIIRKEVHVQGSLLSLTLVQDKQIIASGQAVSFNATVNKTVDTLEYHWYIDSVWVYTTNISTLSHTFPDPGVIRIHVQAWNKVSFSNDSVKVIVQDAIGDIELDNCCFYNATQQSVLTPQVSRGTNVTYIVAVMLPANITKIPDKQQYYFWVPDVGMYTVTIKATNLVSTKKKSINVYTQVPIRDLIISAQSEVYVGQSVIIESQVSSGTDITYKWSLMHLSITKNNVTRQEGKSGVFPVNFTHPGTFFLFLNASNKVSEAYKHMWISSSLIRCVPMVLTAIGGKERIELRSHPLDLEVSVNMDCSRYPVAYSWKVFKDCEKMDQEVTVPNTTLNTPHLALPARSLKYGTYCAKFTAKYERTPVIIAVTVDINITMSTMQAIIDGGSERRLSINKEMVFRGSSSYDPDLEKGEPSNIDYHWTCVSVTTKTNCFKKPQSSATASIPANHLKQLGTYNVTLRISKSGHKSVSTSQIVLVVNGSVAEVFIVCVSCRVVSTNQISSGQPYKLMGTCSNCSSDSKVRYSWTVTRDDKEPLKLNSTTSTTGGDKKNLVIRQGSFSNNHSYTFHLTVTDPTLDITGYSELLMGPNRPPALGTCHVANNNMSVVALKESLDIRCQGWVDPDATGNTPLIYQVYVQSLTQGPGGYSYSLYSGSKASGRYELSPIGGVKETVWVMVAVVDKLGGKTLALSQRITVRVEVPADMTHFAYLDELMKHNFPVLVLHRAPKELFQFTIALAHQLNLVTEDSAANQETRRVMRTNIISAYTDMDFSQTLDDFRQLSYLLKQLTDVPTEFPQNEQSSKDLYKLVSNMVSWMNTHGTTATNSEDVSPDNIMSIVMNMIKGLQATLPLTTTSAPVSTPADVTQSTQTSTSMPEWRKAIVVASVDLLDEIMHQFSKTKVPGEASFTFTSHGMSATGQLVMPHEIANFAEGGFAVTLPPNLFTNNTGPVFQSVIGMEENPYQWGFNKNKVVSNILGVKFRHDNGSVIKVENLAVDRHITLVMPTSAPEEKTTTNSSHIFKAGAAFKTTFNTSHFTKGGLNIEIRGTVLPLENVTDTDLADRLALTAFLGYGYEPFWYKYNKTLHITHNSTRHQDYTFFTMIDGKTSEMMYVTVTNDVDKHSVNITIEPYEVTCQFYDNVFSLWKTDGCQPKPATNKTHSVCRCNHLTIFGASSVVSPGDIDFSDLMRLNLADNPVVVILVSVIAGVFIVVAFWARQSDLQDLHNISIVPLCGRDGLYKYEVVVITGRKRGAGTSSHVGIKLYGNEGKLGARHLARLGAFQRNSEDTFLVASEVLLGSLHKMHIWHDNTGKHPSWYVSRVVIRDLQTNKKTFFLVNSWLSLNMEKGMLDKQVFAAAPEELTNFGTVFHTEASRGFSECHVWLSVWDRPPHSRFTRVQRVMCCTTLLYSFMCANVMWYGLFKRPKHEEQALGLVSINWQDFVVGILASIVVFPINFAIIQIFRFTKFKVNAWDYGTKPGTAQTIEVEAMCDMSQAGDSFIAYDRRNSSLVHSIRRGSSTESILVSAKSLRSGHREITPKSKRGPPSPNVKVDAPNSASPRHCENEQFLQVPNPSRKWWSYDTILKWPEKMPSDPQPESSTAMAGPLRKRSALRSIRSPKDMDCEELIIDDDTVKHSQARLVRQHNNNRRIPMTSTSGTLSSQSIAEIEEDMVVETSKGECGTEYESVQMKTLQVPTGSTSGYESGDINKGTSAHDQADSWSNSSGGKNPHLLSPYQPYTTDTKMDPDPGEVNQALMEINSNIKEGQLIEPRLLNRKKSSMNQGNTPSVDMLRLADLEIDPSRDPVDENVSDLAVLKPKTALRKTKSKTRVSKRWAQIVIPPEYETYKNDHFRIFDPEDEYDAVSLNRSNTIKSHGSSFSTATTSSSRFHQLMPGKDGHVRWLLPHWAVFVAYGMCVAVSGMSIIVTILYGHEFGRQLALKWLLAFFISFLDSVFILEPLKVLALAVFVAMLTRGLTEEDEGIETRPVIESNEKLRDVRMRPIGGFALLQAREEGFKVVRMHRLLRHACVYFLFAWCAFFITYRAHNTNIFPITHDVQISFLTSTTTTGTTFSNIRRTQEMWSWISEVGVPALYPDQNVNNTHQRILLGEVRLRQVRSVPVTCQARDAILNLKVATILDHGCYGNPGWQEDTGQYDAGWEPASGNATWEWSTPAQALGEWYEGDVGSYGGGGYVLSLGATLPDAQKTLTEIAQSNWTDRGTRAIFVEANLYTVPTHLHTTVRILAEIPVAGGGVRMSHKVLTFQLVNHVPGQVTDIIIFTALLGLIWLYLLVVVLMGLRHHTWRYFLSFWHLMEFSVNVIVFSLIVTFIHRVVMDTWTHARHVADPKSFNSFFASMTAYHVWKSLSGLVVFLLTVLMARLLQFVKPLAVYGRTLSVAGPRLGGAVLLLIILVFSISHLGHLWFGAMLSSYRSLGSSLVTVFGLVRARSFSVLGAMHELSPDMAGFFLFTYISTVTVVTMAVFMAVLNATYRMVRLQTYYHTSTDMPDHEMIDFMMKRFKKYFGITKPKPAFRRVKFEGMPSLSSRSSVSSRMGMSPSLGSSGSYDAFGLDALEEEGYLEELLERCVPTWNCMLEKLERVLWLEREVMRLEEVLIKALASFLKHRIRGNMKHPLNLKLLHKVKRATEQANGAKGLRYRRSTSESLVTDMRAQQIRDTLNAELQEMEDKIIADVETPNLHRHKKSISFTEATEGGKAKRDLAREHKLDILVNSVAEVIQVTEGNSTGGNLPSEPSIIYEKRPMAAKPPSQPKRFLNSVGPENTFHKAGPAVKQESSSAKHRHRSCESIAPYRPSSPTQHQGSRAEVKNAPPEAQKAYGSKLPQRDIKFPGQSNPNFTRRPTSEQSDRIKKTPDLPLHAHDS